MEIVTFDQQEPVKIPSLMRSDIEFLNSISPDLDDLAICLNVVPPDISIWTSMLRVFPEVRDGKQMVARTFFRNELPGQTKSLIILNENVKFLDREYVIAILAREMHILYQKERSEYKPLSRKAKKVIPWEDVYEDSADAYAIWYTSEKSGKSYKECSDILYSITRELPDDWFDKRLDIVKRLERDKIDRESIQELDDESSSFPGENGVTF
ncbi:MAG: hypothetical protein IKW90_14720 [Lachnospiraceae bacterium]|nr:hypothetical protein [Lachnospiraceae bacterium]